MLQFGYELKKTLLEFFVWFFYELFAIRNDKCVKIYDFYIWINRNYTLGGWTFKWMIKPIIQFLLLWLIRNILKIYWKSSLNTLFFEGELVLQIQATTHVTIMLLENEKNCLQISSILLLFSCSLSKIFFIF